MSGDLSSAETPADPGADRRNWVEFVRFRLGDDYGLELGRVERILRDPSVTPVPGTGDEIAGVTNLGSQIPVVVDGRELFGLPTQSPDAESVLLLLDRGDARPSGLLVDDVSGIEAHHVTDIRTPAACDDWTPSVGRRWFRAVVVESDDAADSDDGTDEVKRLTGVFDLDAVLTEAREKA